MRPQTCNRILLAASLVAAVSLATHPARAVPLTGGTGPGGFILANGATSLQLWLDSTDTTTLFQDVSATPVTPVTTSADPVGTWLDKSGYAHEAQAVNTTTQRPSWQTTALSSNPSVRFDPVSTPDGMTIDSGLNITATPFTVIILDQYYGATQGRTLQSRDGGVNWLIGKWNGGNAFYANGFVTNTNADTAGVNNPAIGVGTIGTAANSASYFRNGVNITNSSAPTGTPGHLGLGSGGTFPGEVSQADVSEIIGFTTDLNTTQRRVIENYLSAKYNVGSTSSLPDNTLGGNDLYQGDLNANGDYDRDVFGIGRTSSADQVTNAGQSGLGIEATGGLGDNEWALAGHRTPVNSVTSYVTSQVAGQRWDRVWYVDVTGAMDTTLGFDFSDAGLAPPSGSDTFKLLFSTIDSPFNFQLLPNAPTVSGDLVTFALASGELVDGYYTLGINIAPVPEPSTWALFGLGTVGLVAIRRWRHSK